MNNRNDTFKPSDHPALMTHFGRIGFDPFANTAPVQLAAPTYAAVAQRYRAFEERRSRHTQRDEPGFGALVDQMTAGFCDNAGFPAPQQ